MPEVTNGRVYIKRVWVGWNSVWVNLLLVPGVNSSYSRGRITAYMYGVHELGCYASNRYTHFFFFFFFLVLQRAFFYFLCTVSGCDGGNRTRNIVVYTWRLSPLSYDRHPWATTVTPELRPSPLSYDRHPWRYTHFGRYRQYLRYSHEVYFVTE